MSGGMFIEVFDSIYGISRNLFPQSMLAVSSPAA